MNYDNSKLIKMLEELRARKNKAKKQEMCLICAEQPKFKKPPKPGYKPRPGYKNNRNLEIIFKQDRGIVEPGTWKVIPIISRKNLCRVISLDQFIIDNPKLSKEIATEEFQKISQGYNFILEVEEGNEVRYLSVECLNDRLARVEKYEEVESGLFD